MKKKNNIKISYDKESGVFSMGFGKAKSVDSDVNGNVVIDYDKKGKIVRLDVYDFSFDDFEESKEIFKNFSKHSRVSVSVN